MITGLKAEIKLIDDGKYLVKVGGGNIDGDKNGNAGAICKDFDAALELVKLKMDETVKALVERTGTLPGTDGEEEPG